MNKIEHVLRKNELKEEKDFSLFPDSKFTILTEGLKKFYETYQSSWVEDDNRSHFIIVNNSSVHLHHTMNQELLYNQYSSFVFVQMFFEMYFIAILEPISPLIIFAKKVKDNEIADTLIGNGYSLTKEEEKRTIEFSKILNRFKCLVEKNLELPTKFQVPEEFHFLCSYYETIETVLNYRNSIMHRGSGVLTEYYFDWFWVNHLLPLIHKIIRKEDKNYVILRTLSCGIDLLSEFEQTNLPKDYSTFNSYKALEKKLHKICHLKALGRASYRNKLYIGGGFTKLAMKHILATNQQKQLIEEEKVAFHLSKSSNHSASTCPCCGCKTLILNLLPVELTGNIFGEKAECTQCDYQILRWNGEPMNYGILKNPIFKINDTQCQK